MADLAQRIEARRSGPEYGADWAGWVSHQVELLQAKRFDELDIDNLADEVGSLARSDFKGWVSAIALVIQHMLKWDYQPERRSKSWSGTIARERIEVEEELADSPSYRRRIPEAVEKAYRRARIEAAKETKLDLDSLPVACPYDWDAITARPHLLPGDD